MFYAFLRQFQHEFAGGGVAGALLAEGYSRKARANFFRRRYYKQETRRWQAAEREIEMLYEQIHKVNLHGKKKSRTLCNSAQRDRCLDVLVQTQGREKMELELFTPSDGPITLW